MSLIFKIVLKSQKVKNSVHIALQINEVVYMKHPYHI